MRLSGMIEKVTRFVARKEVADQRGRILEGVTGMREKVPIQDVPLTLQNQFETMSDDGTGVGRKVSVRCGYLQWWIPDLRGDHIQGPKDLLGVPGREDAKERTPLPFFLFYQVFLTCHGRLKFVDPLGVSTSIELSRSIQRSETYSIVYAVIITPEEELVKDGSSSSGFRHECCVLNQEHFLP
jgi:hypothetical protein